MSEAPEVDEVRAQLLHRRAALLSDVGAASSALVDIRAMRADRNDDDEHDPDGAPLSVEWTRLDGLHRAALHRLGEIDAALGAVDDGRYGICARCGRPIPVGRLEVMPAALRCVDCADKR